MNMRKNYTHIPLENKLISPTTEYKNGGRYYCVENEYFPSVTTVTGWQKRKFFAGWRAKNPTESKRVLHRGNTLHEAIEKYINNEENYLGGCDENTTDLFRQMEPLLENIDNIYAQEVPLWSNLLKLGGRVDCVAEYNGELSIIDFKGSTKAKEESYIENYFAQASAYAIMWQELYETPINQIVILISSEDGITQEFIKDSKDYVPALKRMIDFFWEENTQLLNTL
jgi:genome maintenance exonuclease 1